MKALNEENPVVFLKRKHVQPLLDYCLEAKIEFTVKPKFASNEEWEVEFNLSEVKKAVALGMFLREIKVELKGQIPGISVNTNGKASKKAENKEAKETVSPISFEEDDLQLNLESNN